MHPQLLLEITENWLYPIDLITVRSIPTVLRSVVRNAIDRLTACSFCKISVVCLEIEVSKAQNLYT